MELLFYLAGPPLELQFTTPHLTRRTSRAAILPSRLTRQADGAAVLHITLVGAGPAACDVLLGGTVAATDGNAGADAGAGAERHRVPHAELHGLHPDGVHQPRHLQVRHRDSEL